MSLSKNRFDHTANIAPSLIGNVLEFYDLGLYGFYATLLYAHFFPESDPFTKTLASLGIFAAGFLMRPLGAILFGYVGDIYGRKNVLLITLSLTALSSFMIGILPTYDVIGLYASFLLTFFRLLQGLCTGGEYNTAAIFILEHTFEKSRGFLSGIITASSILGFFLSSTMILLTSIMPPWGWRIPFIFGALTAFAGYKIRRTSFETKDFLKVQSINQKGIPLLKAFKENNISILSTLSVGWLAGVLSLIIIGFLPPYLRNILHEDVTDLCQGGMLVYMITLIVSGGLSGIIGYDRFMLGSAISGFLLALPIFFLLSSYSVWFIVIGIVFLSLIAGSFLGPMHAYMFSLFPPEKRCSGISFCFSTTVALFGGTAPLICTLLVERTGFVYAPAFYLMLSAAIGIVGISLSSLKSTFDKRALDKKTRFIAWVCER